MEARITVRHGSVQRGVHVWWEDRSAIKQKKVLTHYVTNEPLGHHTEQNKPVRKVYVLWHPEETIQRDRK